jgi:hypothetical protein
VLKRLSIIVLSCAALAPAALVAADDIKLPRVIAWTAYNLGTTGYNQAVAIGKVLKDRHGSRCG